MDFLSSTFKKIRTGGQSAAPKVARVAKSGVSAISILSSRLIKKEEFPNKYDEIASVLEQTDIKYGDKYILKDDDMLDQYLTSSKPKDVIKALNTILSVLVYCTNSDGKDNIAPSISSNNGDETDIRTRIMARFYPSIVNCIINENKEVKKLAMLIITQTFTEYNEATIMCLNSLLKEIQSSDAERRSNGLKLMGTIANNDIYPFIYTHVLKGMNDLNPYVRRAAYSGLLKLRKHFFT